MFIRSKRVKNHRYAYLVKNSWGRKGPRQRVRRYLGRVHSPQAVSEITFSDYMGQAEGISPDSSPKQMILSLVSWVLCCYGFRQNKSRKSHWRLGDIEVDLSRMRVTRGKNNIALYMNNDYLCNYTLRRLLRFTSAGSRDEVALELARAFVGAGIPVPEEAFVEIFQKVYNKGQSFVR